MNLRKMSLDDYEEVVNMYRDFYVEMFPDRVINPIYFFYKEVISWVNDKKDIIVVDKDGVLTGFSMCFVNRNAGLTEPVYEAAIAYVKPDYRKGRTAYMLYHNSYNWAVENDIAVSASGMAVGDSARIMDKHFGMKKMYTNFERNRNG